MWASGLAEDCEAEVPRTMADAITYADLRFVKVPLKNSASNHLGQGKSCWLSSVTLHSTPQTSLQTPTLELYPFQTVRPTRMGNSPTRTCKCLKSQEGHQAWLPPH